LEELEQDKSVFRRDKAKKSLGKYLTIDFDHFISNVNSLFLNKDVIKKFFFSFLDYDISHQQTNETYAFYTRNNISFEFSGLNEFNRSIFFFSCNRSFNGILEMLHFNNKLRYPKRNLLLRNIFVGDNNNDFGFDF
jgi:hypothetical protein